MLFVLWSLGCRCFTSYISTIHAHFRVAQKAAREAEEEARRNMAVERLRGVVTEVRVTRDRPLLEDEIKIAEDAGLDESYPVYVEALELLKELLADEARLGLMKFVFVFEFILSVLLTLLEYLIYLFAESARSLFLNPFFHAPQTYTHADEADKRLLAAVETARESRDYDYLLDELEIGMDAGLTTSHESVIKANALLDELRQEELEEEEEEEEEEEVMVLCVWVTHVLDLGLCLWPTHQHIY